MASHDETHADVPEQVRALQPIIEDQVLTRIEGYALLFGVPAAIALLERTLGEYQTSLAAAPRLDLTHKIMTVEEALVNPEGFVEGMTETQG